MLTDLEVLLHILTELRLVTGRWSVRPAVAVVCTAKAAEQERTESDAGAVASANPVPERVRGPRVDYSEAAQYQFTGHGHSLAIVSQLVTL